MKRTHKQRADEEAAKEQADFSEAVAFIQGPDAIHPGDHVAGLCRVTTKGQSVESQKDTIRLAVKERSGKIDVWYWKEAVEGFSEEWFQITESAFAKAAWRGIMKITVTELSRLVRHPDYRNENVHAKPSKEQLDRIRRLAEKYGITIVSLLPADSPFWKERSFQTLRGECGRPPGKRNKKPLWCKKRKELFKPIALEAVDSLKSVDAKDIYREAAKIVNDAMRESGFFVQDVDHSTVWRWVRTERDIEG